MHRGDSVQRADRRATAAASGQQGEDGQLLSSSTPEAARDVYR